MDDVLKVLSDGGHQVKFNWVRDEYVRTNSYTGACYVCAVGSVLKAVTPTIDDLIVGAASRHIRRLPDYGKHALELLNSAAMKLYPESQKAQVEEIGDRADHGDFPYAMHGPIEWVNTFRGKQAVLRCYDLAFGMRVEELKPKPVQRKTGKTRTAETKVEVA